MSSATKRGEIIPGVYAAGKIHKVMTVNEFMRHRRHKGSGKGGAKPTVWSHARNPPGWNKKVKNRQNRIRRNAKKAEALKKATAA